MGCLRGPFPDHPRSRALRSTMPVNATPWRGPANAPRLRPPGQTLRRCADLDPPHLAGRGVDAADHVVATRGQPQTEAPGGPVAHARATAARQCVACDRFLGGEVDDDNAAAVPLVRAVGVVRTAVVDERVADQSWSPRLLARRAGLPSGTSAITGAAMTVAAQPPRAGRDRRSLTMAHSTMLTHRRHSADRPSRCCHAAVRQQTHARPASKTADFAARSCPDR